MKNALKFSEPWEIYHKKLVELFGKDPEIDIEYVVDTKAPKVVLKVCNSKKVRALREILPDRCEFGNVTLYIDVVVTNSEFENIAELYTAAFDGNPVFSYVTTVEGIGDVPINYIIFVKDPAQFYADDIGTPDGYQTMLYQDIARNIFAGNEQEFVFYCTERT